MSLPVNRPDEIDVLAELKNRVRILEALDPASGVTRACVGCYTVPEEFTECIDLDFNECADLATYDGLDGAASPVPLTDFPTKIIGPYLCNYGAGFRIQIRLNAFFSAGVGLPNVSVWGNIVHGTGSPGATGWTRIYTTDEPTPVLVDTGWVNLNTDPSGTGAFGDDWYLWLGWTNSSIIFEGQVGPGTMCWRYIDEATAAQMTPLPQEAGDILYAAGSPLGWTVLPPDTDGKVLTLVGGLPAWV